MQYDIILQLLTTTTTTTTTTAATMKHFPGEVLLCLESSSAVTSVAEDAGSSIQSKWYLVWLNATENSTEMHYFPWPLACECWSWWWRKMWARAAPYNIWALCSVMILYVPSSTWHTLSSHTGSGRNPCGPMERSSVYPLWPSQFEYRGWLGRLCSSHCHETQSKPSLSASELNASFSKRNKNIADSCSSLGDELTSFLSAPPLRTSGHHLSFR